MKKIFVLLSVLTIFVSANAQLVQFGVTGDVAFDRSVAKRLDEGNPTQPDKGWSAGVKLKVSSPLGIGVDVGAKFAREDRNYIWGKLDNVPTADDLNNGGGNGQLSTESGGIKGKVSFLSVPINLRYDLKLPAVKRIVIPFAFTGPEFCYTFDGFSKKNLSDYVKERKNNWNYNLGFGVILARHIEVSYVYSIRMTKPLGLRESSEFAEVRSRYKSGRNKVGLTIYF